MAETSFDVEKMSPVGGLDGPPRTSLEFTVPDTGMELARAEKAYKDYGGVEEKPGRGEVLGWYFYELCSYFINTVLLPIVFPLIISQAVADPDKVLTATEAALADTKSLAVSDMGFLCKHRQMQLYEGLTNQTVGARSMKMSPFEFTSISWALGLVLAMPILAVFSRPLDRNPNGGKLITMVSIAVGALFCLPVGFVKTTWIFLPYISIIVAASILASSGHTRHFSLMVRSFTALTIHPTHFPLRSTISGWLSLYSTAGGSLGAALMAAFTYHMLQNSEKFISLWIVCIFSGLLWAAGISHIFLSVSRGYMPATDSDSDTTSLISHMFDIFGRRVATANLISVLFSSFATMCIFTAAVLHLVGQICIKPLDLLFLWLTYFLFPLLSLPLSHPLQHFLKADAAKMQILGFLISAFTSGFAYFHRNSNWHRNHIHLFSAIQTTSVGLLHAFGRSLTLDCAPIGKEGVHSMWYTWVRGVGLCVGFVVASSAPGNVSRAFGIVFWVSVVGIVVLVFGNVSGLDGGLEAGNVDPVENMNNELLLSSPAKGAEEVGLKSGVHSVEV